MGKQVPFKYYLHDLNEQDEVIAQISWGTGLPKEHPAVVAAAESRPFYEVEFECLMDDETGEVTIVGATG